MSGNTRPLFVPITLILVVLLLLPGCFGKKDNAPAPTLTAPVPAQSAGNIVADSVQITRSSDGQVVVNWKTLTPSASGGVLGANLFFEGRPLYSIVATEKLAAPATDHTLTLETGQAADEFAIAVIDGKRDIADNSGRGFPVK